MVMKNLLGMALIVCAARAQAAGLPEFEAPLAALLASATAHPKPKPVPPTVRARVTDAATWARLLERARLRPTLVQEVRAGQTDYKVFVVVLTTAVPGQQCAPDLSPRVSLFVAQALRGPGGEVYPARLTVQCVGPTLTREDLAVDADEDGTIGDAALYEPASKKLLQTGKVRLTPAQKARFDALLAGAAARLLEN